MNIFSLLKNIYTNPKSDWINKLTQDDIRAGNLQPFLIQRWLIMNDRVRNHVRYLDKYVFNLPPKMYISLAWSIIPKSNTTPFVKYIKKKTEEDEYAFILSKIRKHLKLSENDYHSVKIKLIESIKQDPYNWFSFYGIEKKIWKRHHLDFRKIKEFNKREKPKNIGLMQWAK